MTNNTQLPAEDMRQLKDKALAYANKGCWAMEAHPDKQFYPGTGDAERYTHYLNGLRDNATEYATKLHQVEQENKLLKKKVSDLECEVYEAKGQVESIDLATMRQNDLVHRQDAEIKTIKAKGETIAVALRRLCRSVSVHPEFSNYSEWGDYVSDAEKALSEWDGKVPAAGLEWLHNNHIEFCYRHPNGRVEVKYRRIEGTPECDSLIKEVDTLIEKAQPEVSPYFYRKEGEKEGKA